jgi:hypothetical protein
MKVRLATLALFVLACWGCESDGEYAPLLDQAGDPCRSPYSMCLDEDLVRECVDGIWTDRSCDESCADIGPAMQSMGCVTDGPLEGCACAPEPGACAPGATTCESDNELGYCDAEQVWGVYDCDSLCESSLATPISVGCMVDEEGDAACWCVAE